MAHKFSQDEIKNNVIKTYGNQDSSNHETAANKKNSKLRKRKTWPQQFYELDFYAEINNNTNILKDTEMGSYYGPNSVLPNYSVPYTYQWDVIAPQLPNQLYTVPVATVPVALISPPLPILPTPVLPFPDMLYTPTYSTVVPYVGDVCTVFDHNSEPISSFAALTPVTSTDEDNIAVKEANENEPLEYYLNLPKDLFPRAKMLTLDPNPITDELCKIKDIHKHSPWILDLEFGVPRSPVTRTVAVYDVQSNNIHCKNTPGAVHPLFEGCSEEFRKIFLFYYDCIVSVWYRGYIHLANDDSVINFQNWLIVPMEALGMCWP